MLLTSLLLKTRHYKLNLLHYSVFCAKADNKCLMLNRTTVCVVSTVRFYFSSCQKEYFTHMQRQRHFQLKIFGAQSVNTNKKYKKHCFPKGNTQPLLLKKKKTQYNLKIQPTTRPDYTAWEMCPLCALKLCLRPCSQ